MPRKKRKLSELKDEDVMKKLFTKKVVKEVKKETLKKASKSFIIKG